jgi:hypothetical protein
MYELTLSECKRCRVPLSCCSQLYCSLAEEWAAEFGITLEGTDYHPNLKFMGPDGCTVPPHLRPSCTLHTCAINGLGFKPKDTVWTSKYFELRDQITEIEYNNENPK